MENSHTQYNLRITNDKMQQLKELSKKLNISINAIINLRLQNINPLQNINSNGIEEGRIVR